jgi:hypothetical protein
MKVKGSIPDLVVWSDDKGYNASQLTYGTNISAPSIKIDDVAGWNQANVNSLNSQFKAEYEELLQKAANLKDSFTWNLFVYTNVKYSFLPIVGHTYHVYEKSDGTFFMSIIEPNSWNQKHVSSTKLDSTNKWIKI